MSTTKTVFQIEKNVPVPQCRTKYPLREMEVGDSFLVPVDTPSKSSTIRVNLCHFCRLHKGYRFTTQAVDGGKALRVWRVKSEET